MESLRHGIPNKLQVVKKEKEEEKNQDIGEPSPMQMAMQILKNEKREKVKMEWYNYFGIGAPDKEKSKKIIKNMRYIMPFLDNFLNGDQEK